METYIVQYGDTLPLIAEKKLGNKDRWYEIAMLNNIPAPYELLIGMELKMPVTVAAVPVLPPPTMPNDHKPAYMVLARGFMFMVVEQLPEIGSTKFIRKIAIVPESFSTDKQLRPANPNGNLRPGLHALGESKDASQFLSGSNKPYGSPTNVDEAISQLSPAQRQAANPKDFAGKFGSKPIRPLIIDADKLPPGSKLVTEQELINDLRKLAAEEPKFKPRAERLIKAIQNLEGETLIAPGEQIPKEAISKPSRVHAAYIKSAEELTAAHRLGKITQQQLDTELALLARSYNRLKIVGKVGRVVGVVGVVFTAVDMGYAAQRSYNTGSYRPLAAETIRQVGGWGGAIAGAKLGGVIGAALGVETGPGLFVTGLIGAVIGGVAGYYGASWVADQIDDNSIQELRRDVNSVESLRYRSATLIVQPGETQYAFRRRALMAGAIEAQRIAMRMVDQQLPFRFADKFAPIVGSNIEKDYKLGWVPDANGKYPAVDKDKDGVLDPSEWKVQQGKTLTYRLGDSEVDALVKMIFGLAR